MELLSLQDAAGLDEKTADGYYEKYINSGLFSIYKMLGLTGLEIQKARGTEITLKDGSTILDFTSAIGILALGHNHPRILAAEEFCIKNQLIDALKVAPLKLQSALAYNLAQVLPDPLEVASLSISGAEAVETALKLCERAQGKKKNKFITTSGSYHGRTHGTLTVSRSGNFKEGFILSIPEDNVLEIPYGDIDPLKEIIEKSGTKKQGNSISAMILEPLQGQGVVTPPAGYLKEVVEVCHENNILVIFDEIKVGMCRTGPFCAFFDDDVVPDVVTLSKALGGGRRAISATVTSREIFNRAYGSRNSCALHGTTFSGLGSSCAAAIETINILHKPGFQESIKSKGQYFADQLNLLKERFPNQIGEIRGKGLLLGVRFNFKKSFISKFEGLSKMKLFKTYESLLIASITHVFYKEHGILVHFSASDPDILHIMPPLIVERHQIDAFIAALEKILIKGLVRMLSNFVTHNLRGLL